MSFDLNIDEDLLRLQQIDTKEKIVKTTEVVLVKLEKFELEEYGIIANLNNTIKPKKSDKIIPSIPCPGHSCEICNPFNLKFRRCYDSAPPY